TSNDEVSNGARHPIAEVAQDACSDLLQDSQRVDVQASKACAGDTGKIPVRHRPFATTQRRPHPELTEVPVAHHHGAETEEQRTWIKIAPEITLEIRQECSVKPAEFECSQQG